MLRTERVLFQSIGAAASPCRRRVSERGREKRWKRSSPREKGSASGSRSVEGFVCGESLGDKSEMVPAGLVDRHAGVRYAHRGKGSSP